MVYTTSSKTTGSLTQSWWNTEHKVNLSLGSWGWGRHLGVNRGRREVKSQRGSIPGELPVEGPPHCPAQCFSVSWTHEVPPELIMPERVLF